MTAKPGKKGFTRIGFRPMQLTNLFARKTWNYGWVVIRTLLAINAMVTGTTFTLGIMLPVISNDLGMDLRQSGWLGAMNWKVTAILTIPLAFRFARFESQKDGHRILCLPDYAASFTGVSIIKSWEKFPRPGMMKLAVPAAEQAWAHTIAAPAASPAP